MPLVLPAFGRRTLGRPIAAYVREVMASEPTAVAHAGRRETDAVVCRLCFRLL